jgi:hypothetical protein
MEKDMEKDMETDSVCPFSIIIGSKLLLRSLGTNISTSPKKKPKEPTEQHRY